MYHTRKQEQHLALRNLKMEIINICDLIRHTHGIDLSQYNSGFLNQSIQRRIPESGCQSEASYADLLLNSKLEVANLVKSLQINYSTFFRNPLTFSLLEHHVLPTIIAKNKYSNRKEIRCWSAASASGHEAYSLAMILEELKISEPESMKYRIFATDQSQQQIDYAQLGEFPECSLDNIHYRRVTRWFLKNKDKYTILPELKKHIDFSVFDLFSTQSNTPPACIYGNFDVVICANLMFYYTPEYQKIIIDKAENCLAKGGYIVVGETERDIMKKNNYREVFPQTAIFQKK